MTIAKRPVFDSRQVHRSPMLMLFALLFFLGGLAFAQSPGGMTELDRERQIQAAIEQLRSLHTQGRYEEVVVEAKRLLEMDPDNTSAMVWLDRAQFRMKNEGSRFPQLGTRSGLRKPSEITPTPTPSPSPTPMVEAELPDFTPVPLQPRRSPSKMAGGNKYIWIIGALVGVALLFVIVSIIFWLRSQASHKKLQQAIELAKQSQEPTSYARGDAIDNLHDAITQVGDAESKVGPVPDEDSVMQFGEVGTSSDMNEEDTLQFGEDQATEEIHREDTHVDFASAPTSEELPPFSETSVAEETKTPAADSPSGSEEESISLGFDMGASEAEGTGEEHSFSSVMFDNMEETAPPSAEQTSAIDPNEMSFNSLMFNESEETQLPGTSPAGPEDDTRKLDASPADDMSFNSLMFNETEETEMPGKTSGQAETRPLEQAPADDMSFNSLMFNTSEETQMPGSVPPAGAGGADDDLRDALTDTVSLEGGFGDLSGEETLQMPGTGPEEQGDYGNLEDTIRLDDDNQNKK